MIKMSLALRLVCFSQLITTALILYTGFATLQHLKYFFPTYVFKYKKKNTASTEWLFLPKRGNSQYPNGNVQLPWVFLSFPLLNQDISHRTNNKARQKINKIKINNSSHRVRSKIQRIQNTYWYFLPTLLYKNYNHKQPWENAFITQIFSTNTKNTVSCIDLIELTVFCALGAELVWPTTSNISSQSLGSKHNPSTNLHLQWLC